jgi:hypothetical protein
MKREKKRKRKKMDRDMAVMGKKIEERTQHNNKALREEKEQNKDYNSN